MRTASLTTLTLLACGLAFGRSENAVYTAGNLDGMAPQANVVVDLSGDKALKVRSGRTDFSVPYAGVTKTDVSATDVAAAAAPDAATDTAATKSKGKKSSKSAKQAQTLTVEFNNAQGEARSMTLQLTQSAAASVMAAVRKHSPAVQTAVKEKPAKSNQAAIDNTAATQADAAPKDATAKDKSGKKLAKKNKKDKSTDDQAAAKASDKKDDKTQVAKNDNAAKATTNKDGSWWGDSIWKTNRNQAKWEQQSATAAQ